MLSLQTADQLDEMGRAALQFAEQFELERVLEKFESELIRVAAENERSTPDAQMSSSGT